MAFWQNRKVLVTGGAGFIGTNLVERLVGEGARVRAVDSLERSSSAPLAGIEFLKRDLRDRESCLEACRDVEVVFHLAAKAGSSEYYRRQAAEVMIQNVLMDTQMLDAARGCGVERYFYASSVFAYPEHLQSRPDARPLKEEEAIPANPPISYGWAKLVGEKAVEYAVHQDGHLRSAIFRMMNPYGPYQDIDLERGAIIPVLIRRALEYPKEPFVLRSTGEETRSFCYISDVVDAMLLAMEKLDPHQLLGPLNIGSENSIRIIELAREIVALSGKPIEIRTTGIQAAVKGQAIDCSRARQLLDGWEPKVALREGLARTYAYVEARLKK